MPIRPEIALAFQQPQIESPLNAFAKYAAIQNAQNQNALAQYQLSSAQRQDAQQNAANAAWQRAFRPDGTIDRNALYQQLASSNAGSMIPGVQKTFLDADTAEATLNKTRAEARERQRGELAHGLISVYHDPTDDKVNAAFDRLLAAKADPALVETHRKEFLGIADPEQRKAVITDYLVANKDVREAVMARQPKPEKLDIGGKVVVIDMNPLSATYKQPITETAKTVTPDAVLSSETSRRGQDISAATTVRGQNMTDARAKESNAIAAGKQAGERTTELRKEFNALPAVKSYGEVQPVLQSAREALSTDTAAADLNLIYAAAKIFDPNSVVRESETNMVVQAGSPAQRFMGQWNYVAGGGRLTADARKQLMGEIESRARGYESAYNASRKTYEGIADKSGVPRDQVFVEPFAVTSPAPAPKAAPKAEAKSEAPKIPKAGDVVDGWKFKGGNPADKKNWEKA